MLRHKGLRIAQLALPETAPLALPQNALCMPKSKDRGEGNGTPRIKRRKGDGVSDETWSNLGPHVRGNNLFASLLCYAAVRQLETR